MARSFADVLREVRGGDAYSEATARLTEVVEAVNLCQKAGEIALILKITPNGDSVIVTDTIKTKVPEATRAATLFFVSDGALVRQDPRQQQLPLRSVPEATPVSSDERGVSHG